MRTLIPAPDPAAAKAWAKALADAFATAVRATIGRQLDTPPSDAAAGATLQALYSRYDSAQLAHHRADARC